MTDALEIAAPQPAATAGWREALVRVGAWACLLLVFGPFTLGALVTSYKVGMAVPDGFTTFGEGIEEYRWRDKDFGIKLEHTHRLAGRWLGKAALALAAAALLLDRRRVVRGLALAGLLMVCVQGLLGIYRVELHSAGWGSALAATHASTAPLVLTLYVTLVCATSDWWTRPEPLTHARSGMFARLCVVLAGAAYVQIVLGALLRHRAAGFWFHAPGGYLIAATTFGLGALVVAEPLLRRRFGGMALALACGVFAQIVLGNAAALLTGLLAPEFRPPITNVEAFTTAAHHFVGSVFFAGTVAAAWHVSAAVRAGRQRPEAHG